MPVSSKSRSRKSGQKGGRKGWTTAEQQEWLEGHVDTYIRTKSTEKRRLGPFWTRLYEGWFDRWPVGPNPPSGAMDSQQKRLKQWFNNHTRGTATQEIRKKPLNLIKRQSRKLALWQAYSRLFYEKKLKAIIDDRWKEYIAKDPALETKPGEVLRHRNANLQELFKNESEEVKAEVERRREEGLFSEDEEIEDDGEDDVGAIEKGRRNRALGAQARLKCTIEPALEEIKNDCGLVGFIVIGGPEPKCGGDLMIMSAHTGTTGTGLNFGEAYTGWKNRVEEPFIAFLNKVFSREERQEFALPGTEATQDFSMADNENYRQRPHVNLDATNLTSTPEIDPDYDMDNLSRLLDDRNLYRYGVSDSGSEVDNRDNELPSGFVDDPERDNLAQEDPTQEDPAQEDHVQEDVVQEVVVQEVGAQEVVAQEVMMQEDGAQDDVVQDDPVQEDLAQDDPAQEDLAQDDPAQEDLAQEDPAQEDRAQEDPVQEDPEQDGVIGATSTSDASTSGAVLIPKDDDWPEWFANGMKYLQAISKAEPWVTFLTSVVKLERSLGFAGARKLGGTNRPDEIASWFKNGRKYVTPKIKNIEKYKVSCQTWWQELQPKWRILNDGTFQQEVPDIGEEWEVLRHGGPNGFFLIVMAIAWWMDASGRKVDDKELLDALDDITWVVQHIADMPAKPVQLIGGKRAWEDKPATSKRKRK